MNQNGGIKLPRSADGSLDLAKLVQLGKQEQIAEATAPLSQEEQCLELIRTVKCKLGPSSVHGVGVIAMRDIVKGEQLFVALTVKPRWYNVTYANLKKWMDYTNGYPEIYRLILDRWPQVVNGSQFISPNYDARLVSFMNHSDTPNYDPRTDLALADIKAGEEVFEDYRVIPNYEKAFSWLQSQHEDIRVPEVQGVLQRDGGPTLGVLHGKYIPPKPRKRKPKGTH